MDQEHLDMLQYRPWQHVDNNNKPAIYKVQYHGCSHYKGAETQPVQDSNRQQGQVSTELNLLRIAQIQTKQNRRFKLCGCSCRRSAWHWWGHKYATRHTYIYEQM